MVNFAKSLGHPWRAIHVAVNPQKAAETQEKWDRVIGEGELVLIPSPYRHLVAPIREFIREQLAENPDTFFHVIVGHLVMDSMWKQALHQNSVLIFNLGLTGLERVVVTIVPHQINENGHRLANGH
jgi:hypothetical protein